MIFVRFYLSNVHACHQPVSLLSEKGSILDMLSPSRSSAQAVLKAVVTTASTIAQESTGASASASIEEKDESNDVDDDEPAKKKFKDDSETEVNDVHVEIALISMFFRSKLLLKQQQQLK